MYAIAFRKAAVTLYDAVRSLRTAARYLQVSYSSISRWVKSLYPSIRGISMPRKLLDMHKQFIKHILTNEPFLCCQDIVSKLFSKFQLSVSRQLVHVCIRKLGFRRVSCKVRGGSPSSTQCRDFVTSIESSRSESPLFVSVDESGFDQRPKPTKVYRPPRSSSITLPLDPNSNSKYTAPPVVIRQAPYVANRKRFNLLLAIASDGSKQHSVFDKSINAAMFADFISQLPYPSGTCILLDNAKIHHTASTRSAALQKGYTLLYIPPYSPELNPVELAFASMKNKYYRLRLYSGYCHSIETIHKLLQQSVSPSGITGYFRETDRYTSALKQRLGI